MTVWYAIETLDGRTLSETHSVGQNKWLWITEVISNHAECDWEDVNVVEAEDGDFITVKGKKYARVVATSFPDA